MLLPMPWQSLLGFLVPFLALVFINMVEGLKCYSCRFNQESSNKTCIKDPVNTDVITCKEKETHCKIYSFEIDHSVKMFERSCADDCQPSCTGHDGNKKCTHCCSEDICNMENGSPGAMNFRLSTIMTVVLSILFVCSL